MASWGGLASRPSVRLVAGYNVRVPVPLIPLGLEQFGRRPFSFYPAIVGIEHNAWVLRRVTWADVEVVNTKTAQELVIPRRFLREVSGVEEPILIVGLAKELEHKEGAVLPYRRRVIEMPRAVNGSLAMAAQPLRRPRPAAVIGIRLETGQPRPLRRALACVALASMLLAAGILAWVQAVSNHLRGGRNRPLERAPVQRVPFRPAV
jgi:hypothetical protein